MEDLPTLFAKNRLGFRTAQGHGSEVATLNQKKTVDCSFKWIEFEGWFVVANTQRRVVNGEPNDVNGAVKTPSAIPPMSGFQLTF